jgi:flotillin
LQEIYKDRKKFSASVFEVASSDLYNMGINVVSYTIKDISDKEGYLKALGFSRTAQVKKDARIGEAEARRDAGVRVSLMHFVIFIICAVDSVDFFSRIVGSYC